MQAGPFFSLTCIYEIGIILHIMKKYENLAKTIYDIGKLSFATLILGQFGILSKFHGKIEFQFSKIEYL